ncbi:MAG: 1,4-dihydroxy-6-naphthoate synthase [Deltaproteobacteria bacterium]|nr:1,4-dihydroxy-6-naphthoate synthase [Deltaproteobacteria bacterium]MBW2048589.1 1,4-dihydroxy-6-naphthoate synthase [Deltaproteobacteria bacterium]MBW2111873.1 1,4-dihydroxy-6-naphthoate synthase [Deltaproteobacteria bacterium]
MRIEIGYSTCPNDTYIFAGLERVEQGSSLRFKHVLADVETLNQWAFEKRLHVTKLSFFALGLVQQGYGLLYSGGALGRGCGPILVARPGVDLSSLEKGLVAAPGNHTTARLLLTLYSGHEPNFSQMVFSEVMPAVSGGKADFGLVIHEGRFTCHEYDLQILVDLGEWWESETGRPIPLGGIAIRRDLGRDMAAQVDRSIRRSLALARTGDPDTMDYVLTHAREMAPDVVAQHIDLYVNDFSMDLGQEGMEAVELLFSRARKVGLIPPSDLPIMAY